MTAAALGLALLILIGSFLSACPSLHRHLHRDTSSTRHSCLVCMFAGSQVGTANGTVLIVTLLLTVWLRFSWKSSVLSLFFRLSPFQERAPPLR
jgi:hypothetical protein